jgi:hypothetical protein
MDAYPEFSTALLAYSTWMAYVRARRVALTMAHLKYATVWRVGTR